MATQIAPAPALARTATLGENLGPLEQHTVEALPDILRSLRVSSSIISHGSFSEPWAVRTDGKCSRE